MGCSSSTARVSPAASEQCVAPQGEGEPAELGGVPEGQGHAPARKQRRKQPPKKKRATGRPEQLGSLFAGLGRRRSSLSNVVSRPGGSSGTPPLFTGSQRAILQEEEEEEEEAHVESARKHNQKMGEKLEHALAKAGKVATKPSRTRFEFPNQTEEEPPRTPASGPIPAFLGPRTLLALARGANMAGARGPEGGSDSRSPDSSPRHCGGRGIRGPDREESDKGSLHMEMMERCHCNSTVGSSEANNGKMLSPLAQHLTRCLSLQERRKLGHPQQRGQQCPQEQAVSRSQLSSPVQGPPSSGVFTPTGATPSLLQVPSRMMEVSPAGSEPSRLSSPHLMGPPSGPSSPLPSPSPCAFADSADQDVSGEGLAEHHEDQRLSRVLSGHSPPPPTHTKPNASSFRAVGFGRPGKERGTSVCPGVPSLAAAAAAAAAAASTPSSSFENSDQVEVLSLRQENLVRVLGPPLEWRSKERIVRTTAFLAEESMTGVILATAGYDHSIRLWEAASGKCSRSIPFNESQVNVLAVTPDRSLLAAAGNNFVRLFDLNSESATHVAQFDGHTGNITSLSFSSDGMWIYTGSEDNTIKMWDMRSKSMTREFQHNAAVNSVVLHPNEREFLAGDELGEVRVWDISQEAPSHELIPDRDTAIRSVAVNADGNKAVAANNKGMCFVWLWSSELKDLSQEEEFKSTASASRAGGSSVLEEVSLLTPRFKLEAHQSYILKTVFSPDGRFLATTSADKTVALWDVGADFSLHKTLEGHQRWVWDCAFSADSAYMVTASSDGTARLWDVNTAASIKTYKGHDKSVVAVCVDDRTDA